jgi:anti-sigma regulatory factor (Ser/Thr protein kinase)
MESHVQLTGSADARALIRFRLRDYSCYVIELAEILTTELVNNAIVHGGGEAILIIEVDEDRIRVEVYDAEPTLDLKPVGGDPMRASGRGLAIVDTLASSWGVDPRWAGKVVWFNLAR